MNTRLKNYTLEALLGSRVPFKDFNAELYLIAKESGISDNRMLELLDTHPNAFYQFKKERQMEKIVEGTPEQSIFNPDPAELQLRVQALEKELKTAEGLLFDKDKEINRLNNESAQMQESLNQASRLIRGLEAENEQLRNPELDESEITSVLQENIQLYKNVVKNLAVLL